MPDGLMRMTRSLSPRRSAWAIAPLPSLDIVTFWSCGILIGNQTHAVADPSRGSVHLAPQLLLLLGLMPFGFESGALLGVLDSVERWTLGSCHPLHSRPSFWSIRVQ